MNRLLTGMFCGMLIAGVATAGILAAQNSSTSTPQSSPQPPAAQAGATQSAPTRTQSDASGSHAAAVARIASGSVIPITLTKTVDAKKAKVGDLVLAKVTDDLKSNAGELLLAKDTKVLGHVTQVQVHSKEQQESQLGVAFDRAQGKNGGDMQMPMSIQAVISLQSNGSSLDQNNNTDPAQPSGGGSSGGRAAGAAAPSLRPSSGGGMSTTGPLPSAQASGSPNTRPAITAQTQGVIGIPNLTLNAGLNPTQGSVLSSVKNNVKIESGTMMLLRVD